MDNPQNDFIIKRLDKLDVISTQLAVISSEMTEIKVLTKKMEDVVKDVIKLETRVTKNELDLINLAAQVAELRCDVDSACDSICNVEKDNSVLIKRVLYGLCTALFGALIYTLQKLGVFP